MDENNQYINKTLLRTTCIIVFLVLLVEVFAHVSLDPVKVRDFGDFVLFFGDCLFSILAASFLALIIGFFLACVIEAITRRISTAYNNGDSLSLFGWIIVSLCVVCVLLYGVYSLYRPLFLSDLDKERENFDPESDYVYVTETGSKYHLSNCPSLKSIADEMYIYDAEDEGYEPCRICDPPH